MTGYFLRRVVATMVACVSVALLTACGSSTTESAFKPARIVSFGDATADLAQRGARYTVNDGSVNTPLEQIATSYTLPITASASGGLAYGKGSARVTLTPDAAGDATTPTVTQQIDSFLASKTLSDSDLVIVSAGVADVLTEAVAFNAGTQTEAQMTARLQQAGRDLGAQARRLVTAGSKHVVVIGAYNLGISPWATATSKTSVLINASLRFNEAFLVSVVDLGATVLYVDAAYYFNLLATSPSSYGLTNAVTPTCTSVDSGTGIGIGTGQINSTKCTTSTLISGIDYNQYMFADAVYMTPIANRLFGSYAYDRIRQRW